jgi:hypothetical protein
MAFKINNPLSSSSSPLAQHKPGHRFSLDKKLEKERQEKAAKEIANFELSTTDLSNMSLGKMQQALNPTKKPGKQTIADFNKFNKGLSAKLEQDAYDRATGTTDSREGEASSRAFEDYKDRLSTSKQYGMMDQFGVYSGLDKENESRESQEGYTYLPIGNMFGGNSEGDNKKYPVLSSKYGDNNGNLTSNMFVNPNSAEYGNFARREASLGNERFIPNNPFNKDISESGATNSYMGGTFNARSGVDYPQEFYDENQFQNPGQRLMGSTDVGGFRFNPENNLAGFANQEEQALNARNASNYAVAEFRKALAAGDKAGAQTILDAANNQLQTSTRDGGFGYTAKRDDGMYGVGGLKNSAGDRRYVNSPGVLFGYRTKDNLQFRTDQASNLYDTDYMPTRSEEVDLEASNRYNMEKLKQMGIKDANRDYSINFNPTYSFDPRSGR